MVDIVVDADVKFGDSHVRGLQTMRLRGDAPVVAEMIRVAAGGDLPAHPESAKADLETCDRGSPRHLCLRAYPIPAESWKGRRITRHSLLEAAERIARAFGAEVVDGKDREDEG